MTKGEEGGHSYLGGERGGEGECSHVLPSYSVLHTEKHLSTCNINKGEREVNVHRKKKGVGVGIIPGRPFSSQEGGQETTGTVTSCGNVDD